MKKIQVILFLITAFIANAQYQPPTIQWQKVLGGASSDYARSVKQTSDGGYIIVGYTNSKDYDLANYTLKSDLVDFWVVKLNASGSTIEWGFRIGSYVGDDHAYDVVEIPQSQGGGYYVVGDYDVYRQWDYFAIKISSDGKLIWERFLGGGGNDHATSVDVTSDGGCIIAGYSNSYYGDITNNHGGYDYWVVKIDKESEIEWQRSYGGLGDDRAFSVQAISRGSGGYMVAGYSNSKDGDVTGNHGQYDYWLLKLKSDGSIDWEKSYGNSGEQKAYCVKTTADGGYIAGGTFLAESPDTKPMGYHGKEDYWVLKVDANGNELWNNFYGGSEGDLLFSLNPVKDGYILGGYSSSTDGDLTANYGKNDFWIVRIGQTGGIKWQKNYGGGAIDNAHCVVPTNDGGYIIAGTTESKNSNDVQGSPPYSTSEQSDFWIAKLNMEQFIPISFGIINAQTTHGVLLVDWTITAEGNNDYFIIEASQNGKDFTAISDKILTKAKNGVSSGSLHYSFSIKYSGVQGMAVLLLLFLLGFNQRKRHLALGFVVLCLSLVMIACQKNTQERAITETQKLYIRIQQVDKEGQSNFSKVIQVIKN